MTQPTSIVKDDVFIVAPGRSVLTAKRGMAHAGGEITLADIRTNKPFETMKGFFKTGKVLVDTDAREDRAKAAHAEKQRIAEAVKDGQKRADAAKADEAAKVPPTQDEIIEAIGKLDKDNKEHWMADGVTPQVAALEGILGKQITAADRTAAYEAMQAAE